MRWMWTSLATQELFKLMCGRWGSFGPLHIPCQSQKVNDLKCVKLNWLDKKLEADGDLYRTRARSQMNGYIVA